MTTNQTGPSQTPPAAEPLENLAHDESTKKQARGHWPALWGIVLCFAAVLIFFGLLVVISGSG